MEGPFKTSSASAASEESKEEHGLADPFEEGLSLTILQWNYSKLTGVSINVRKLGATFCSRLWQYLFSASSWQV